MACLAAATPVAAIPEGPEFPSAEWTRREARNYARVLEAPLEQAASPAFLLRLTNQSLANLTSYLSRATANPSRLLAYPGTLYVQREFDEFLRCGRLEHGFSASRRMLLRSGLKFSVSTAFSFREQARGDDATNTAGGRSPIG